MVTFGEKAGVAFQLLDDVIDLSADPDETGKVPGTDLRAGVPTMPYLVLGRAEGCRIRRPARPHRRRRRPHRRRRRSRRSSTSRSPQLRDHEATAATLDLAHAWSREAVDGARTPPRRRRCARRSPASRRPSPTAPVRRSRVRHRFARSTTGVCDEPSPERTPMTKLRLAIVGAGPAGIYAADIMLKAERKFDVSIDLFEQLPAPYGLVRYGVAPDHPRIKGIITALREVLDRGDIRIFGNVRFGEDITLDDLKHHYHAVIFATGAIRDTDLDIPGIDAAGSYGAADFVSWFDGHPDVPREWPLDAASVAVIGNGNVALDVSRMLAKHAEDLLPTEIPDNVYEGLAASKPSPTCTSSAAAGPRR